MRHNTNEDPGSDAENAKFQFPENIPSSQHKESMAILDSVGDYKTIADAEAAVGTPGAHPLLERMIATARKTAGISIAERKNVKDNVIHVSESVWQGSGEQHAEGVIHHIANEAGAHESPVLLTEGELANAQAELEKLQDQKKGILNYINTKHRFLGFGNKKHREINQSMNPKNLPEIGKKIHKLESDIAFTKLSSKSDHQEKKKAA